jgi:hypothetical protein
MQSAITGPSFRQLRIDRDTAARIAAILSFILTLALSAGAA